MASTRKAKVQRNVYTNSMESIRDAVMKAPAGGLTISQIASKLGRSSENVSNWMRQLEHEGAVGVVKVVKVGRTNAVTWGGVETHGAKPREAFGISHTLGNRELAVVPETPKIAKKFAALMNGHRFSDGDVRPDFGRAGLRPATIIERVSSGPWTA